MSFLLGIQFARPGLLYLLLIIIPLIAFYIWRRKDYYSSIQVSSIDPVVSVKKSYKEILRHILFSLRMIVIILMILALARPQTIDRQKNINMLGIDIVLSLDVSSSMLARDFKPDRLEAAKDLAVEFIAGRPNDRMGVVVFSSESFTQCPLTTDHAVLTNLITKIQSGIIEDGTAIGVGLANAVNRLKDSEAISKVIILLTDGVNNSGVIDPATASDLAKKFNIRVYTIGVGSKGEAPYPVIDFWGRTVYQNMPVEIDEATLQHISKNTGGKYFRATNNSKLRQIYSEIDKLEKSKIDVKEYNRHEEAFMPLIWLALTIIFADIIVSFTIMRSIP